MAKLTKLSSSRRRSRRNWMLRRTNLLLLFQVIGCCADVSHCNTDDIYWARRHCSWQPSNPIQGPSIFRKRVDLHSPLQVRFPIAWVISRRWSKYICYAIDRLWAWNGGSVSLPTNLRNCYRSLCFIMWSMRGGGRRH